MHTFFLYSAVILTIISVMPAYRVVKGPTVFDRLLGTSAIGTNTIVLICLIGYLFNRIDMFIDITLAYAVLGFIGSIAVAKYFATLEVHYDE